MGIGNILRSGAKFAAKTMAQALPYAPVLTGAAFGAGILVGTAIKGDSKKTEQKQQAETRQKAKTGGTSANKTNKKQEKEKLKEQVFEYVSPKVGEDGIECADTIYFTGTKKPKTIMYYRDEKRDPKSLAFEANYKKDGKIDNFTKYYDYDKKTDNFIYIKYDDKGNQFETKLYSLNEKGESTGFYYNRTTKDYSVTKESDLKDRTLHYHSESKGGPNSTYDYRNDYKYNYNNDGTYGVRTDNWSSGGGFTNTYEKFDKNDRLIYKQDLDENDVVKYTVTPKYSKDGMVIKNDTTWNQPKK